MNENELYASQREYYDRRAEEYRDWHNRKGRYTWGVEQDLEFFGERHEIIGDLLGLNHGKPIDRSIDLACGIGAWSLYTGRASREITLLDSSPNSLEICRDFLGENLGDKCVYLEEDLFTWEPPVSRFDAATTLFFISHVLEADLMSFFGRVHTCLKPGAVFYIADSKDNVRSHLSPEEIPGDGTVETRLLGSNQFQIVKQFHNPGLLAELLSTAGFNVLTINNSKDLFFRITAVAV
jgi:SAM-dependent methyltransferase